jgi:kumamolisin
LGGHDFVGGGTSAVAPLWAALVARLNEALGRPLGWIHRELYDPEVARTFRMITRGNNDVCDGRIAYFRAGRGWNACTGLGTPDGISLLQALQQMNGT